MNCGEQFSVNLHNHICVMAKIGKTHCPKSLKYLSTPIFIQSRRELLFLFMIYDTINLLIDEGGRK